MSTNIPTGDAKIIHIQKLPRPPRNSVGQKKGLHLFHGNYRGKHKALDEGIHS